MTIIRNFEPEENKKKYIFFVAVCLFILILVEIWSSNIVASFGENFASTSQLKQALIMENQILENEIAEYASLSKVASESAKLGFSRPQSIQYIR